MMKIKAGYTNVPQWRMLTVKATLPEELKCLDEIAHKVSDDDLLFNHRRKLKLLFCDFVIFDFGFDDL